MESSELSQVEYSSGRPAWTPRRRGLRLGRRRPLPEPSVGPRPATVLLGGIAFALLLHLTGAGRACIEHFFPLRFQETLARNARHNGLSPSLVAALVRRESAFETCACSHAGARGLMQLMPDTARWTSEHLQNRSFRLEALEDSEMNVQLGTRYLSHLKATFGDHPVTYLAAYNAGPANVHHWLDREAVLEVERIPFPETRRYVASVLAAQKVYQWLYPGLDRSQKEEQYE